MLLVPLVFYGQRVRAERVGGVPLFCGLCVESRPHDVLRLEERATLYGIVEVGDASISHVSRCSECDYVTWIDPGVLDPKTPPRRRSDLDAFLRAHATVRLETPASGSDIAIRAGLAVAALALCIAVDVLLVHGAGCGLFLGLLPAVLFVYLGITRAHRERVIAEKLRPKLERLLARTGVPMRALAPRARQLGAPHLARLFESRAFDGIGQAMGAYR